MKEGNEGGSARSDQSGGGKTMSVLLCLCMQRTTSSCIPAGLKRQLQWAQVCVSAVVSPRMISKARPACRKLRCKEKISKVHGGVGISCTRNRICSSMRAAERLRTADVVQTDFRNHWQDGLSLTAGALPAKRSTMRAAWSWTWSWTLTVLDCLWQ